MIPSHHPTGDLLFEYATGTASEAVALLVATHLALCPGCRIVVDELDEVGGAMISNQGGEPLSPDALESVMARLDEPSKTSVEPVAARAPAHDETDGLPWPLRRYVGAKPVWRRVVPGIRAIELPVQLHGEQVRLVSMASGLRVPRHTHAGIELHLVLSGGFTDKDAGHFVRGDVQCADDSVSHALSIDRGARCVTLLVRAGRDIQLTFLGRAFAALTGA